MMSIFEKSFYGYSWIYSNVPVETPGQVERMYASLTGAELALFERVCAGLPCPKAFIEKFAAAYGWPPEMIASCKIFTPSPLPHPVIYSSPWNCFENSFHTAESEGLLYVEGLAISPMGPDAHAWNSADGNDVIDRTWPCQHLNRYFGKALDLDTVRRAVAGDTGGLVGHLYRNAQQGR
jgi:hypothetical protein